MKVVEVVAGCCAPRPTTRLGPAASGRAARRWTFVRQGRATSRRSSRSSSWRSVSFMIVAAPKVFVDIPGSSARLVEVALASGLRMEDPGLLLLWPPVDPPRSLAIHSDWLL